MYMRLVGIPASKISIITTYNGQKDLINDIVAQRCGWSPLYGTPAKIATTDKFQGQQNDYILLSLVRTKSVGHIRDVRSIGYPRLCSHSCSGSVQPGSQSGFRQNHSCKRIGCYTRLVSDHRSCGGY